MNSISPARVFEAPRGRAFAAAIEVSNLVVEVDGLRAVDDVSFSIRRGRTFCLIGESGCGKSLTCLALLGRLPPNVRVAAGRIAAPGAGIAMIYQDATASLNPVLKVGEQIAEPLRFKAGLSASAARAETLRLLDQVGIPDPRRRHDAYPHELSGGMNQRIAIARALACRPDVILADEPTTALDVTVQAQILDLLRDIQDDTGLGIVFVTHDLGVAAEIGHDLAVMYAGRIVEQGSVEAIFARPSHPYTAGLLACLPRQERARGRLAAIPGVVPPLSGRPAGCGFAPRCPHAADICRAYRPDALPNAAGTVAACHFPLAAA